MIYDRQQSLAEAAAALVPDGDASFVGSTSLPALKARHERQQARFSEREDRFSQLIANTITHDFVGDFLVGRSGLTEAQRSEVLELAPAAAVSLRDELVELMRRLRVLLLPLDPLLTTAHISFIHTFGGWGDYFEPTSESLDVDVETVAGIFATQQSSTTEIPTAESIEAILGLLMKMTDVRTLIGHASAFAPNDDAGYLSMIGTAYWANVRGDAYVHHARDLAFEIFDPIESWMRAEFGFTIADFYKVADAAISLICKNVNEHRQSHAERINGLVEAKNDLTPEQRDAVQRVYESLFKELPDCLVVTVASISEYSDTSPELVRTVLNNLSIGVGTLPDTDYRGAVDESPLFSTPFLRDGEKYVLPVPGHLLRSPHDLFEVRLLKRFPAFSHHRADTIDRVATSLLARALPGAEVATNVHYRFDDGNGERDFETDGIVLFEGFCLIVEGKAGRLSVPGQRGDLVRLQRDLSRGLDEAWKQCARVHSYLKIGDPVVFTDSSGSTALQIDNPARLHVLYVNPMLHSLGAYAHELPRLRALGLFAESGSPWPILVTDLRVIVEMLRSPAELLHYIQWRNSLPIGESITVFDELDIVGNYLFGRVGRTAFQANEQMFFSSSTMDFDAFYAGELGTGPIQERPRKVLGDFFETILLDLAEDRPKGWLESSFAILDLPLGEATELTWYSEKMAYREIAGRRWVSRLVGDSVIVALADGVTVTEVLFEIAQQVPTSSRRFIVQLEKGGPRLLLAQRSTR